MPSRTMLGVFDDGTQAARAIDGLRDCGVDAVTAYGPAPHHDIDRAERASVSPVRLFTLVGGLLGCATGFALPIYSVYDWPLITGGKPLISIPPFVVIAFELTILFGAISGMIGFLLLAGLPRFSKPALHDPRFSNDTFGVLVRCDERRQAEARAALEHAGATEITSDA